MLDLVFVVIFVETDINRELEMIDVDIRAVHILTKMFLKDMKKRNSGYILNVASAAAFAPGPLMATYYSCKAYVYRLTEAIAFELKKQNRKYRFPVFVLDQSIPILIKLLMFSFLLKD